MTIRQQMVTLLAERELTALELSQMLRIREKEVYDHLSHIRQSLTPLKKKLLITPASCLECGYTFGDRRRVTKPGRCPRCKGEHIEDPRYRIQ